MSKGFEGFEDFFDRNDDSLSGDEADFEATLAKDLKELGVETNGFETDPDEDSSENILARFNLTDYGKSESEVYEKPILIETMAYEVSQWLERLTIRDAKRLESEKFLELCEMAGIMPDPRTATAAFTDLVIMMEEEDYRERSMTTAPNLEDLQEKCEILDDLEEVQRQRTLRAHRFLTKIIKDPLLDLPALIERRKSLQKERPQSVEEFDEMQDELEAISRSISALTEIEEVKERREIAFRCMDWLLKQDYLRGFTLELRSQMRKGEPIDFDYVAGAIAGRCDPIDGSYNPGVIDELLERQKEVMNEGEKTSRQKVRESSKLRRLEQAKAICDYVFKQDILDRIYTGDPIRPSEFKKLEFIRHAIYIQGNTSILDRFIEFLPGGKLQNLEASELKEVALPNKLSGRSLLELFNEINTVIIEHPGLNIERITELVEAKLRGQTTADHEAELAINSLKILEKLAYKENHSVSGLVRD